MDEIARDPWLPAVQRGEHRDQPVGPGEERLAPILEAHAVDEDDAEVIGVRAAAVSGIVLVPAVVGLLRGA